jgi:chemotaxis protein methyltransferase CheR
VIGESEQIEVDLFLEAVRRRYGYDFGGYAQPSIRRRVRLALARSGAKHLGELQHRVLHEPALLGELLQDLTVRVSSLFRDPQVFLAIRTKVVPVLRTYPVVKAWHCGCADGEEVYSFAILLAEEGLYERAQIYATDLSITSIERAKSGLYTPSSRVAIDEDYAASGGRATLEAHVTTAYGGLAMNRSLAQNLHFFQHNVTIDRAFGEMHIVFCRNVLIYFGRDLRSRVIAQLKESLVPGGFLSLGASEQLTKDELDAGFEPFCFAERIYRRTR